jgi:hypothetical protein
MLNFCDYSALMIKKIAADSQIIKILNFEKKNFHRLFASLMRTLLIEAKRIICESVAFYFCADSYKFLN